MSTAIRVYNRRDGSHTDFEAAGVRIDISPDGSMLLTRARASGETRLNPQTGKLEEGIEIKILAVFGPSGDLRAETVDIDA